MDYLINLNDVPWESDREDGWGADDKFLFKVLASKRIGCDLTRVLPGETACPYHFHYIGEELFIVLEGEGLLRYNGEEHRLKPMDIISCPPGPSSAHQIINDTDKPLVYFSIGTNDEYDIAEYPDSAKVMAWGGPKEPRLRHLTRKADVVGYMDGEVHPLRKAPSRP
jgi:uncharacterized cupin superfamily protein